MVHSIKVDKGRLSRCALSECAAGRGSLRDDCIPLLNGLHWAVKRDFCNPFTTFQLELIEDVRFRVQSASVVPLKCLNRWGGFTERALVYFRQKFE